MSQPGLKQTHQDRSNRSTDRSIQTAVFAQNLYFHGVVYFYFWREYGGSDSALLEIGKTSVA